MFSLIIIQIFVMILLINDHKTCTLKEKNSYLDIPDQTAFYFPVCVYSSYHTIIPFHNYHFISLLMLKVHICLPYSLLGFDGLVTCLICQVISITLRFASLLILDSRFDTWHNNIFLDYTLAVQPDCKIYAFRGRYFRW